MKQNDKIEVELETTERPYRIFGEYQFETEQYVIVVENQGDNLGKTVYIPRHRIKLITVLEKTERGWGTSSDPLE